MNNEEQKIFPISLVMESMKDSGYKDAAHAIAELIDNSIQAGETLDRSVDVELICLEESNLLQERQSSQIFKIAVYDNASGMSPDVLQRALAFGEGTRRGAIRGIGKFGMGLPNASISQCSRVDVWSWQNATCYHSYLDIEEIVNSNKDTLPLPVISEIPQEWKEKIKGEILDHGTLVVWSNLDRLKWKRHKAFFLNTEFIVGRMYRYFIQENKCNIRMAAYSKEGRAFEETVKANDPLYLMSNTSSPKPFQEKGGFVPYPPITDSEPSEETIDINFKGKLHHVLVKFSIADHNFRRNFNSYYEGKNYGNPGDTPFGKHCGKNLGISVIRAGRELELNNSFNILYDPTERWWGAEIHFDPALDEVFGVTNNKQAATAFKQITKNEIANEENISRSEVEAFLEAEDDNRRFILEISQIIGSKLSAIRGELGRQREGVNTKKEASKTDDVEKAASDVAKGGGSLGYSDMKGEQLTLQQKEEELREDLERDGVDPDDVDVKAVIKAALDDDNKFIIGLSDIRGADIIFDVTQPAGKLKVTLNESHPAYKHCISPLKDANDTSYDIVRLLFASWALMEDLEPEEERREQLLEIRKEWGQHAKKMIKRYLDN